VNQLLHLLVHGASHAFQHYRHQQHEKKSETRHHAHRLSRFAGVICDLCEEAEFSIYEMESECVTFWYRQRQTVMADGGDAILCYASTPYRFYTGIPRDLEEFLERRNASLQYGVWVVPHVPDGYNVLLLRVPIIPEGFNLDVFKSATEYSFRERAEVEAILARAGYKPQPMVRR
jgi:hypothetical protein